ncbi:MAG: hypothetical protein SF051_14640 [Elusimicrobiota bacterium]|nr:hypothetical protein [Elusimicrobiota bacterium]
MKHGHHAPHPTGRRRKSGVAGVVAVGVAAVAAAFAVGYLSSRQHPSYRASEARSAFDAPALSPQAEASVAAEAVAPQPALDAALPPVPAASSLVAPLPLDRASSGRKPAPTAAGKVPVVTAKAVKWARTHRVFAAFLKAPARMLAGKGARLASPGALKTFLADREQVEAYLDSPLVRIALNSPVVSKALLSDPKVATAFLGSPAMRDPEAVKALMTSSLFRKIMDCPGPQGALEDPSTLTSLVSNPATLRWLGENPDAMSGIAAAAPALAQAYAPKLKRR